MPNRLAGAVSPYLRMHADDPVDWYPWGTEAFERSRAEGLPIFLSSGYYACHWCHVMQRESFRDPDTAEVLNTRFVPVKVDREERPDVDALYMDYVVASAGRGGWPMSVFLSPELAPLFGGTYFPRQAPDDVVSFMDVLDAVTDAWQDPVRIAETVEGALEFLGDLARPRQGNPVDATFVDDAAEVTLKRADLARGGFGDAPKFPQAPALGFLLRYFEATREPHAELVARQALTAIVRGGIFDQAGGGIHRYAVDADWTVPHFEKMLYDNALLLSVLARANRVFPDEEYARAAVATARFLGRDLAAPGGGLHASLSAESGGVEGTTYVWTREELEAFLTPGEIAVAERRLGLGEPNWHGRNVLTRHEGRAEEAEATDAVLAKILEARSVRRQPDVDTKVVVSWNAHAARGLIEAGAEFDDAEARRLGIETLETLLERATVGDEVVHVLDDPAVAGVRLLEDAGALAAACLAAADIAGRTDLADRARAIYDAALPLFDDGRVIRMTANDSDLPVRPLEQQDSPTPSGASLMAECAVRFGRLGFGEEYEGQARRFVSQFAAVADISPLFAGHALAVAVDLTYGA